MPDTRFLILRIRREYWEPTVTRITLAADEVFCPVHRVEVRPRRKRHLGKAVTVEKPIFFGYIAVRPRGDDYLGWPKLKALPCVLEVLRIEENPILVKRKHLRGLMDAFVRSPKGWEGVEVEFVSGPLVGQKGVYRGGKVEIDFMGRTSLVTAPFHDLRRAEE